MIGRELGKTGLLGQSGTVWVSAASSSPSLTENVTQSVFDNTGLLGIVVLSVLEEAGLHVMGNPGLWAFGRTDPSVLENPGSGLAGNAGLFSGENRVPSGKPGWEQRRNPEEQQSASRSWLRRGMRSTGVPLGVEAGWVGSAWAGSGSWDPGLQEGSSRRFL